MRVKSFNGLDINDGAIYKASLRFPYTQAPQELEIARRALGDPVVTNAARNARVLTLMVQIVSPYEAKESEHLAALLMALDAGENAVPLVVTDDDGERGRYLMVAVSDIDEQPQGEGSGRRFAATLVSHLDAHWRLTAPHSESLNSGYSDSDFVVVNGGDLIARPVYTLQPLAQKEGAAFTHGRFVAVRWTSPLAAARYPILFKTDAADVPNPPDQFWEDYVDVDGLIDDEVIDSDDNVAVFVDGQEVRRWILTIADDDVSFPRIWANLDFVPGVTGTLATGIADNEPVLSIQASTDISKFPIRGLINIGREVFEYSGRDTLTRQFTGVTRAARGTDAYSHSGGSTIYWIQHEVWVMWGSAVRRSQFDDLPVGVTDDELGAPYDIYKPAIALDSSSNSGWLFRDYFGGTGAQHKYRPAAWQPSGDRVETILDEDGVSWSKLRLFSSINEANLSGRWSLPIHYPITAVRIVGDSRNLSAIPAGTRFWVPAGVGRTLTAIIDDLPDPFSQPGNLGTPKPFDFRRDNLAINLVESFWLEQRSTVSARTDWRFTSLTFSPRPSCIFGEETELYAMNLTLRNSTTSQSLHVELLMELEDRLEIDTANHTVRLLSDGSNRYQAVRRDAVRKEMLPLVPGSNWLWVTEDGLTDVTLYLSFEERVY